MSQDMNGLGLFLTGGASNSNPDASLGGAPSATWVRGLGALVQPKIIPALRIEDAFPANGAGAGSIEVNEAGAVLWKGPGDSYGSATAVAAGADATIPGGTAGKSLRVNREAGLGLPAGAVTALELVEIMNGVLAQKNVANADRLAGKTTYRAIMLEGTGLIGCQGLVIWLPSTGGQATWAIALETPVNGAIQSIANETTAPTGLTFSSPSTMGAGLTIPNLSAGQLMGLWIKRTFPAAGHASLLENVKLALSYQGVP